MSDTPRPFSDFQLLAYKAEKALRRLLLISDCLAKGCGSLTAVSELIDQLPDCFSFSTTRCVRKDKALKALLKKVFGKDVDIYPPRPYKSAPIYRLSEEGQLAADMARQFFAEMDK
jgi:hypothetical protein